MVESGIRIAAKCWRTVSITSFCVFRLEHAKLVLGRELHRVGRMRCGRSVAPRPSTLDIGFNSLRKRSDSRSKITTRRCISA
jgi:hypothetical protein